MAQSPQKLSKADRVAKVQAAVEALPDALAKAARTGKKDDFEAVEQLGAIVHRQGRLLAGKKKGG